MSDGLKLISSIIANGSAPTLLSLDDELFTDEELPIFDFVRGHHRTYRALPEASTVQQETGRRLPVANEPLDFYVDTLYQRHEYNQIRERFSQLRESLHRQEFEESRQHIRAMSRIIRLNERRGREVMQIDEAMGLVVDRLTRTRGYGGITGITTGWNEFDAATGGYQDSDLITWVGRPSLGKTYLLLKQAKAAHDAGHNVLFVTTEMGIEQIARRYASIEIGVNPTFLKRNEISSYVERRIRNLFREMAGAERFRIFSVGMKSKVNAIEALIQEFGPSIVFVDGAYLLRPTEGSKSMNRIERITGVFDELKALNLDCERPFVVTSQFNRQAGKGGKEGTLETIGYTDAIGTHSSVVVAIKAGPTENPMASRYLEFLKGREGETGQVAINFKFAPLDMSEFTPEQQEAEDEAAPANLDWMQ